MGIEDGIGGAAEQVKKVVTGDKEDKQNKQQDDEDVGDSEVHNATEGRYTDHPGEFLGGH